MLKRVTLCAGLLASMLPATVLAAPVAQADDLSVLRQLARDLDAARRITKGRGVTVAIVSTGVDKSVGSLRGKVKPGKDFVNNDHADRTTGTLLASLVAGAGLTHYSPVGMRGLASGADILPIRIAPEPDEPGGKAFYEREDFSEIQAKGIRYAADHGAQVICIDPYSWGNAYTPVRTAVAYALSKNATVVAGAARIGDDETSAIYPAAEPGVIGVGALDLKGHRIAKFSGKNSSVLVGAPGFAFPSIGPGNTLWTMKGTLPAIAWVASTAAMVRAEHPKLSQALVAQAITSSAHHPKSGYDTETGYGIINPIGALKAAQALEDKPPVTGGRGAIADTARFGGHPPARIQAVRHDQGLLAGFGGLAAAGLLAVMLALFLAIRGRRRATAVGAGSPAPLSTPESPDAVPPTPGDAPSQDGLSPDPLSPDAPPGGPPGGGAAGDERGPGDALPGRDPDR
ncbi:S8 family peptidase [Actinomadura scrupuli]|uniref:S8 family peptidase n=1 Tax=Actinomadura scrupuli TaxID=559629 RepID=UPI003D98F615